MANVLPKISFQSKTELDIEVMTFAETYEKLSKIVAHNPFAPHKIQFYLILVVTENSYEHYVDFKRYSLQKGCVLFIAKNQVHYFNRNFDTVKGYCIILNRHFLEQNYFLSKKINLSRLYNYHLETPLIYAQELEGEGFLSLVEKLYIEYNFANTFAKLEMLQAYVDIILLKAERVKQKQSAIDVKAHWLDLFNEFKILLETHYTTSRSSRFYATKLLISYKFLNDIVKKYTDKTVKSFIDDFVTMEIKRYLASTSLSVKEISYKTGFDEPANMIKFFKKHTQLTPLQFRVQL